MINKNSRPKKVNKQNRTSQVSVRMTPMERKLIEFRAKESGYSMSSFMVKSSLENSLKILSAEEKRAYIDLAKYHTNFSRISSLFREKSPILDELQIVITEIREHLKQLQNGK